MWFVSWLAMWQRSHVGGQRHRSLRRRPAYRPRLEALEDRWVPSQISLTVISLADSGPGTLRDAMLTADGGSHSDKYTIDFAVTGTVALRSSLPDLIGNIAIAGPGASRLTVAPGPGAVFFAPIVTVDADQTASVSGLTVANGFYPNGGGGAIANLGTLTVASSILANNFAGNGGAIANSGTLTLDATTLSGNSAEFVGGGIHNLGTLIVSSSTISGNFVITGTGIGGGVLNEGDLTISSSTICGNSADKGGGIFNSGTLMLKGSTLTGNTAAPSPFFFAVPYGGGIANDGTATIVGSTLTNNAAAFGGGIESGGGALTISSSTVSGNRATLFGGGIENDNGGALMVLASALTGNSADSYGGGIYNSGSSVTVKESTLTGNSAVVAGGGIYNASGSVNQPGTLTLDDSTVDNNTAPVGADVYNLSMLIRNDSVIGVLSP